MKMSKSDFLLEIGMEEIPARYILDASQQLSSKLQNLLKEQNIAFGKVQAFSTPRRLAVLIEDVSEKQEDIHEEVKGPAKKIAQDENGNWTYSLMTSTISMDCFISFIVSSGIRSAMRTSPSI